MIDRRQLLASSAFGAAILAMPMSALAGSRRIYWERGTLDNPHALTVARHLHKIMEDGCIYSTGDLFGNKITLKEPLFRVKLDDIIFHPTRGFRYEPSLSVEYYEKGFFLGRSGLGSFADYADYWGKPKPVEYPDIYVKALHNPYDSNRGSELRIRDENWDVVETRPARYYVTQPQIEEGLGKDAIEPDMRWLDFELTRRKAETAA